MRNATAIAFAPKPAPMPSSSAATIPGCSIPRKRFDHSCNASWNWDDAASVALNGRRLELTS